MYRFSERQRNSDANLHFYKISTLWHAIIRFVVLLTFFVAHALSTSATIHTIIVLVFVAVAMLRAAAAEVDTTTELGVSLVLAMNLLLTLLDALSAAFLFTSYLGIVLFGGLALTSPT